MNAPTQIPLRVAGLIGPKANGIYIIGGIEPEFHITAYWRGHVVEHLRATSYPEAVRLSRRFADAGYVGWVPGAAA